MAEKETNDPYYERRLEDIAVNSNKYWRKNMKQGIWAKGLSEEKNIILAFTLDLDGIKSCNIKIAASSAYRLFVDGKFLGFGPNRAAHGYARITEYTFEGRFIAIEVLGCGIKSFWLTKQPSFFKCNLKAGEGFYSEKDFTCRKITDRAQKVPRYSYQRCFSEIYRMYSPRDDYSAFPIMQIEPSGDVQLLRSLTLNPHLTKHYKFDIISEGNVSINLEGKPWRDRAHYNVGKELDGFEIHEWEEAACDDVSKFCYDEEGSEGKYIIYDFGRAITGFLGIKASARGDCTIYLIFDELLWNEEKKGKNNVSFYRGTCNNVLKWTLKDNYYDVFSFEPYTARYVKIVMFGDVQLTPYIIDYQNPETDRFFYKTEDEEVNQILAAAVHTFEQNAVDLLIDCPSRERAGWLSDSWFSSVSELLFTGRNRVEEAFLQNYALCNTDGLPEGMIPMCYPADLYDNLYIPNWAMWYVYEIVKYAKIYGKNQTVMDAFARVEGIVRYFDSKLNEYGLLENLESWIFVEWSAANNADRVCGVNIPSNICWAACLMTAGSLFEQEDWVKKGMKMASHIKQLAFDGKFFVDNLVRNQNGMLIKTNHYSEVCQYYAFWFDIADKHDYSELYEELMERLGNRRVQGYLPEIEKPNAMYGIYMRLDLLMREGKKEQLYKECKDYFLKMAQRTGTLWENNFVNGSCVHGFASYAAKWLVFALCGFDVIEGKVTFPGGIGIKASFEIPRGNIKINVEN